MLRDLSLNIPPLEVLRQMFGYVRFMKEVVTKKMNTSFENVGRVNHYKSVTSKSLTQKKGDL